ncbi:Retrovirus-related Pol polyprotein from transposon opus, partial [Mucuna pruriens]
MCDASNLVLRTILGQRVGKRSYAIAYASCILDLAQANYTTIKNELLAIVFSLDKFRSYLLSSKIIVFFDHLALKFLLKKLDVKLRLICWMRLLQESDIEIREKSGVENLDDHVCGNFAVIKWALWIASNSLEVGFIGPPFSRMPTISLPPVSSAKEQKQPSPR